MGNFENDMLEMQEFPALQVKASIDSGMKSGLVNEIFRNSHIKKTKPGMKMGFDKPMFMKGDHST